MDNEEKRNNSEAGQSRSKKINIKISCDVLKWIIFGLAIFVAVVLIFGAGIFVGEMKARFSYRWAENYHKNFGGPQGGFMGRLPGNLPPPGDFIEGHGTFGEIIKINDSDFVIKGQGDVEKVVVVGKDTVIDEGRKTIKKEDLKVGDCAVIIGSPNESGQIEAKLIRIMPSLPESRDIFPNKK
jgi:hypothetical protein